MMRYVMTCICLLVLVTTQAQAATIGFNFTDNDGTTFSGQVGATLEPGIIGGANWNNVGPVGTQQINRDMDADILSPTVDAIVDNSGSPVAGMSATYSFANAAFQSAGTTGTAWDSMIRGVISGNNLTTEVIVTLSGIPYERYDVYAFVRPLTNNHDMSISDGTETFYFEDINVSSKILIASTTPGSPTEGGNYALFSNRTSSSITLSMDGSISGTTWAGMTGIQIVEVVPEPNTVFLAVAAALGGCLCVWRKKLSF